MKFFFPDSQDQVDPHYDFIGERHLRTRVRQRDEHYAHEALGEPAYSGVLVSKVVVDGINGRGTKYTFAQTQRLYRSGIRRFFRLDEVPGPRMETMGDCGAFHYVQEEAPPISVDDAIDFYEGCRFDLGVSVDHIILGFINDTLPGLNAVDPHWRKRQQITLELAGQFLTRHAERRCRFSPVGVAQGWSPESYAYSVSELQKMGYRRIGLGGMVPLKTQEILACLKAIDGVRNPDVQLHLFGVTRVDVLRDFSRYGVTSFDSTSPLMQAFKDDHDNYHTMTGAYAAIRIPQVDGNPALKKAIKAGRVDQTRALKQEKQCLETLRAYERHEATIDEAISTLKAYEAIYGAPKDREAEQRATLEDRPWQDCPCRICTELGIEVIFFRGAQRNRRRGFHNLYVLTQKLQRELSPDSDVPAVD